MNPALLSSKKMDWTTPQDFFDALAPRFNFGLDVCASHGSEKVENYIDPEMDGLRCDWERLCASGRGYPEVCWMNPPYGRELGRWIDKAIEETKKGLTVVCLVPARTDTKWFGRAWKWTEEALFVRGRLHFGDAGPAPFPSVVLVLGPRCGTRRVGFIDTKGNPL
jgi:phage N-6-adenine-methyltransferase